MILKKLANKCSPRRKDEKGTQDYSTLLGKRQGTERGNMILGFYRMLMLALQKWDGCMINFISI